MPKISLIRFQIGENNPYDYYSWRIDLTQHQIEWEDVTEEELEALKTWVAKENENICRNQREPHNTYLILQAIPVAYKLPEALELAKQVRKEQEQKEKKRKEIAEKRRKTREANEKKKELEELNRLKNKYGDK